jgi:hypothetical protein
MQAKRSPIKLPTIALIVQDLLLLYIYSTLRLFLLNHTQG